MRKVYDKFTHEILAIGEKNYQEIKNSEFWKQRYSLKIPKKEKTQ
jgi:hypothetical protein